MLPPMLHAVRSILLDSKERDEFQGRTLRELNELDQGIPLGKLPTEGNQAVPTITGRTPDTCPCCGAKLRKNRGVTDGPIAW